MDESFLGADDDLDHVIAEAERLVITRRYSKLNIRDAEGAVVARVYVRAGDVWVTRRAATIRQRKARAEVLAGMEQMEIPGLDWSQF
jgi:hypothetical protein